MEAFGAAAAVSLLAWLGGAGAVVAQDAEARPVTWSAELAGPARGDLERALTAPFADGAFHTRSPQTGVTRQVATCRDLLDLPAEFVPGPELEYQAFRAQGVRCRTIVLLLKARPATSDFLGALALDRPLFDQLPASLIPSPAPRERRPLDRAGAAGVSWRQRDRGLRMVRTGGERIIVESAKIRAVLTVLGRGDVDGDGRADVVLERAGGGRTGTWASTEAFVLTRRGPTTRLEQTARIE
jgi:hypothetical protein